MRRVAVPLLILAGLLLVARGAHSWLDGRQARSVVAEYLEALRAGDRERALRCLTADRRAHVEAAERRPQNAPDRALPDPGFAFRIHRVELAGDTATVEVRIERGGFRIQPRLHLERAAAMDWKIAGIDPVKIDPRWEDLERARARAADAQIVEELERALSARRDVPLKDAQQRDAANPATPLD